VEGQTIQQIDRETAHWPPRVTADSFQSLWIMGEPALLATPLLGILCSRQCPGEVIVKTYDVIRAVRTQKIATVGGFHSPMEKECLDLLLRGTASVVICLARSLEQMRVSRQWLPAIVEKRAILASPFPENSRRTTAEHAQERNQLVSELSERLLVPYAAPESYTEELCLIQLGSGKEVLTLDRSNARLIEAGARILDRHFRPFQEGDREHG